MSQWLTITPPLHQIAIVGQVNDSETDNALRDVSVEITEKPPKFQRYCQLQSLQYGSQWDKMKQRCDLTYTSIDGYFYFADIPDGNYTLTFSIPHKGTRYGTTSVQTQVVRDAKGNINRTQNPDNSAILNISLIPTTLKGHILDVKGKAIANAKIKIEGTQETTISNSEGKYRFTQLEVSSTESNQRQLTLSVSGYGYSSITQIATIQQGTITTKDFTLSMTNKE
ncbi:carboxypeptidase regulatory-like domain-containing protein [Mastigocoleus testarum]|uniref:Carboxypeptidase regulatory-like domain-containing protein n=1 Tax=Mastigocoleus testarum BC008 TaxID=371196 RepID=A0A0V7ZVH1_9CYAN|nr:carboxypeptidase regulatory-like domain-containing protein [Mastigocoleus testarum]KST68637.1 hypothetical protein BC008_33875 [Mastigocoleus testarum BC008]